MGNKLRNYMLFAVIAFLCIMPRTVFAADTEYDLNQQKTAVVAEDECFAASGNYTWLKYTPKADGRLTIILSELQNASQSARGYISLYSGSKTRILSSKSIFYNTANKSRRDWYEIAFGLQKGQTYYVRIKGDTGVTVTRTFSKIKDTSGAYRTNAKSIKKNKNKMGLIPAGVSEADWYKIKLTKKQKIRIYYNVKTRGKFKISVYSGTRLIASQNVYYTSKQRRFTLYLETNQKQTGLKAGEYYIKVERGDAVSSGSYKIKWN